VQQGGQAALEHSEHGQLRQQHWFEPWWSSWWIVENAYTVHAGGVL
jgi:hypothetical protein